jgi:hypothetical protein
MVRLAGALAAGAALGACGATSPGSFVASRVVEPTMMAPVTTIDGTQQFDVPAGHRPLFSQRLQQLVGEPIQSAQISNGWRTQASASATPNDYAACVSATTASGTSTFMVVKSGAGTGDVKSKSEASAICNDPKRVVHWTLLNPAMAGAAE